MHAEKAFISCSSRAEETGPRPGLNSLKLQRHCQSRSRHRLGKLEIPPGETETETSEWMLLHALTPLDCRTSRACSPPVKDEHPLPTPGWMTMQTCLSPGNMCPLQDLLCIQDARCRITVKKNSARGVLGLKTGETDHWTPKELPESASMCGVEQEEYT